MAVIANRLIQEAAVLCVAAPLIPTEKLGILSCLVWINSWLDLGASYSQNQNIFKLMGGLSRH